MLRCPPVSSAPCSSVPPYCFRLRKQRSNHGNGRRTYRGSAAAVLLPFHNDVGDLIRPALRGNRSFEDDPQISHPRRDGFRVAHYVVVELSPANQFKPEGKRGEIPVIR